MHTQYHRGPGLHQARWDKTGLCAQPSHSLCLEYLWQVYTHFTRCTIRNQHDILKTAVADVSNGQTDMSLKGELQALTKLSMRHKVCPSETCRTIISEYIITMLMEEHNDMHWSIVKNLNKDLTAMVSTKHGYTR